jgi:hypothetical protein
VSGASRGKGGLLGGSRAWVFSTSADVPDMWPDLRLSATISSANAVTGNVCPVPRAAMSSAASGGRTVEPVTEEDF